MYVRVVTALSIMVAVPVVSLAESDGSNEKSVEDVARDGSGAEAGMEVPEACRRGDTDSARPGEDAGVERWNKWWKERYKEPEGEFIDAAVQEKRSPDESLWVVALGCPLGFGGEFDTTWDGGWYAGDIHWNFKFEGEVVRVQSRGMVNEALDVGNSVSSDGNGENDSEESSELFREEVIDRWNWRPERGVTLKATAEAREYVTRYADRLPGFSSRNPADGDGESREFDRDIVLFQTDSLDVVVLEGRDETSPNAVMIFSRSSGEVLHDSRSESHLHPDYQFVEVTGEAPLELQRMKGGSSGTGLLGASLEVFRFEEEALVEILDVGVFRDSNYGCPGLSMRGETGDGENEFSARRLGYIGDEAGLVAEEAMSFVQAPVLMLRPSSPCSTLSEPPRFRKHCRYREDSNEYQCRVEVEQRRVISSVSELEADSKGATKRNIRWVLEHLERLRRHGYVFEEGIVKRLRARVE